ncbi:P-loop containing nucleoside triphosphate hydrolase protein [Meredithblackwellia eburnea MCA 4105]
MNQLAQKIVERLQSTPAPRRVIVAVAGVPGSGKSVLGYPLADKINSLLGLTVAAPASIHSDIATAEPTGTYTASEVAVCVGLDGWHYTREALSKFPDPEEAKRRRGAAFTFDAEGYTAFVLSLRETPAPAEIPFPTFSHALKDPVASPFPLLPSHRVVIIEGLYALLNVPPWSTSVAALDERVWIDVPREVARERLIKRHVKEGVEPTLGKAQVRVDTSDMLNGNWIREHLTEPTVIIRSVEDPTLGAKD